jgi:hypothetical protein
MATVFWSGNKVGQPAQGEMRRFVQKARIDARTTTVGGTALVYSDTNKACLIKAGWIVKSVIPRMVQNGSTYNVCQLKDSGSSTFGPTFPGGGDGMTTGIAFGATMLAQGIAIASGGKFYASDDYVNASFSVANFDGILDLFLDIIDTNAYEVGASFSNNNL